MRNVRATGIAANTAISIIVQAFGSGVMVSARFRFSAVQRLHSHNAPADRIASPAVSYPGGFRTPALMKRTGSSAA